jgi:hypothetical protein
VTPPPLMVKPPERAPAPTQRRPSEPTPAPAPLMPPEPAALPALPGKGAGPGSEPRALTRDDETGSILIIPDIDALEAAAAAPRPARAPDPGPITAPVAPPAASAEGGRSLTADGLPELSGLFVLASEDSQTVGRPWAPPERPAASVFDEELPAEPAVELSFAWPPPPWSPEDLLASGAVGAAPAADQQGTGYWGAQQTLLAAELAAAQKTPRPSTRERRTSGRPPSSAWRWRPPARPSG